MPSGECSQAGPLRKDSCTGRSLRFPNVSWTRWENQTGSRDAHGTGASSHLGLGLGDMVSCKVLALRSHQVLEA